MLDSVYQTVQALMNKEQLGYLKPLYFNLFAANAQRKEYGEYFTDLKSNVRKQNWHLDGKNFANLAENSRQLIEHYSVIETISGYEGITDPPPNPLPDPVFTIPSQVEFIQDVFVANTNRRIDKVHYSDFKDLQRNIYAAPNDCSPLCAKVDTILKVAPLDITAIEMHYLRKPKTPKWTFVEDSNGKPFFNPSASDFQDFDMPETSFDKLVSYIAEQAGVSIRDAVVIQAANQEQSQDTQLSNRQ